MPHSTREYNKKHDKRHGNTDFGKLIDSFKPLTPRSSTRKRSLSVDSNPRSSTPNNLKQQKTEDEEDEEDECKEQGKYDTLEKFIAAKEELLENNNVGTCWFIIDAQQNQQGNEKYKYTIELDGGKKIFVREKLIYDEYERRWYGGKRKSHKRKSHKRKSHKRKSHKRKSHKRK